MIKKNSYKDLLNFLTVFTYFAINSIYDILFSLGFSVEFLINYNIIAFIKIFLLILLIITYKKFDFRILLITFSYLIIILLSTFIRKDNSLYSINFILIYCINILPILILLMYNVNNYKFFKYLKISSYFIAASVFIIPFTDLYLSEYGYMEIAYSTIIGWATIGYYAFRNNKWYDIIIYLMLSLFYFMFASRGATIIIILFTAYMIYYSLKNHKYLLPFILLILIVFVSIFANSIILNLSTILGTNWDISYTINRIVNGSFFQSNSRVELYKLNYEFIKLYPFGNGIGFDRVIGGGSGYYSHNIILEILLSFGVIIGSILIFFIIYVFFTMLINREINSYYKDLFIIMVFPGSLMLIFSGSVFETYYIFVGIYIYILFRKQKLGLYNEKIFK